jgi:ABC-2 type transport system ATP-binding protein
MASLRRVPYRERAVWRAMEACHIEDRADSLIGRLSKGLRQRVGLAQAILHDPEVLILDEPTIGLDPKQIIEVRELIKELGKEHTVILSTHILPEVSQTCRRVLIINRGRIVAEGTPDELTAQLQGAGRVRVQVGGASGEAAAALADVPGVVEVRALPGEGAGHYEVLCAPNVDRRAAIARAVVERGWALLALGAVSLSLEDIFLELTTDEAAEAEREEADA